MSKVDNSYKARLKTILKQHHFNVNRAQMNKHSCTQILVSVHMYNLHVCKICVYANCNLLTWSQPGANFKTLHMVRILPYVCKSIYTDRFAHKCVFAYMQIFSHVRKSVHVKAASLYRAENHSYCGGSERHNKSRDMTKPTKWLSVQHPPSLISVFAVRMKKAWVLSYPLSAQRRLWSDWADLSRRWAHSHFVGFAMSRLNFNLTSF